MTTCADLEYGGSQSLTGLARLKVRQDLAQQAHTYDTDTTKAYSHRSASRIQSRSSVSAGQTVSTSCSWRRSSCMAELGVAFKVTSNKDS